MTTLKSLALTVLALCALSSVPAQDLGSSETVSVIGLQGIGADSVLVRSLQEQIESRLSKKEACRVVSRSEIARIMAENGLLADRGEPESEMLLKLKTLTGIQKVITGTLTRLGPAYNLILKSIDIGSQVVERSVSRQYAGPVEGLFPFASALTDELIENRQRAQEKKDSVSLLTPQSTTETTPKEVTNNTPAPTPPEAAPIKGDKMDGRMEKIGIGAIAIFACIAAVILANTTHQQ